MLKSFQSEDKICKVDIIGPILKMKENWPSVVYPRLQNKVGD